VTPVRTAPGTATDPDRSPEPPTQAPVAFYVHVPFCVSICPYCDFVVYPGAAARGPRARIEPFMDALERELELRAAAAPAGPPLETVYIGGGTPSLVAPEGIGRLVELVAREFGIAGGAEVTLEVNPGPDERGDAGGWRAAGVTRISIGAQSFDVGELRRLGRRHRPADVAATIAEARAAGIGSVSVDLLYDVPGGTLGSWQRTLDAALALEPDHCSLYALTLDDPDAEGLTGAGGDHLPTTPGAQRWRVVARRDQDEERAAAQYEHATERLAAAGWRGYEISNWARPGHESRHNLVYWQRRPYEAIGPGAHAFDGVRRRWNAARLDAYLEALLPDGGGPATLPPGGSEIVDDEMAAAEAVILGLRTDRGVAADAGRRAPLAGVLAWAVESGLIRATDDARLVLTTRGRLLSNEVFARLV
jgi:oxygen-independent coproporphyrinogen-3 oxidase